MTGPIPFAHHEETAVSQSAHQQPDPPPGAPRPGSFKVGKVAGVPVYISYSWVIVAAFISFSFASSIDSLIPGLGSARWIGAVTFVLLFYASVFLHEAAHTLVAKALGMRVVSIVLHFFGGFSEMAGESRSPWRSFAVAVAGPVVSIGLGMVYFASPAVRDAHPLVSLIIWQLGVSNLFVGLFNLLPGMPLDGGHILEAFIWGLTRRRHVGALVAGWAGRVLAVGVLLAPLVWSYLRNSTSDLALVVWGFLLAGTLWMGATASLRAAKVRRVLPSLTARSLARSAIGVPYDVPVSELVNRAAQSGVHAVVLLDHDGKPASLVSEAALEAVPAERRPWVAASSVARTLEEGLMVPDDLEGEALLHRLSGTVSGEYLVIDHGGTVVGVLSARDVNAAFA
jgi:Zn-dependent protease